MIGQKFNRLTVLGRGEPFPNGGVRWACRCECGSLRNVAAQSLRRGTTKSCGCYKREVAPGPTSRKLDLSGRRIYRLTVIRPTGETDRDGSVLWESRCDCGNSVITPAPRLKRGSPQSCGCLKNEQTRKRFFRHGESKTGKYWTAASGRRRAAMLKQTPFWSETEQIREFYKNCPDGMTVDHIVPLQGELVRGLHVLANLQYLSLAENSGKCNRFEPQVQQVTDYR